MLIRISIRGAVYSIFALLLFTGGLLQGELLSAVCGGILIAYSIFAAATSVLTYLFWKEEEPEVTVCEQCFTVSPEKKTSHTPMPHPLLNFRFLHNNKSNMFPLCTAGILVSYVFEFSLTPPPALQTDYILSIPLQKRQPSTSTGSIPRGRYFYQQQYLHIQDFAGFISIILLQKLSTIRTHTVLPELTPVNGMLPPTIYAQTTYNAAAIERTAELYESRPYFPGDDPRKIHWKLYAHTRMLAIKLGAFEPPPVKHLCIYIEEPVITNKKERQLLMPLFDAFIERISFFISQLLESGIQCTLMLYDYPQENQNTCTSLRQNKQTPHRIKCKKHHIQKTMQIYPIPDERNSAVAELRKLLAVPSISSVASSTNMQSIFSAVPTGSGLLYCYLPIPITKKSPIETIKTNTFDTPASTAEAKAAASLFNKVQTIFYLAAAPCCPATATILNQLLYPPPVSAYQQVVYQRLAQAAEQDIQVLTARNCYAETL